MDGSESGCSAARPLCVDLDGSLCRSDTLIESALILLRSNPLNVLRIPFWLVKGRAHLKAEIASRVDFTDIQLPLNEELLRYVEEERRHRKTVLVTGCHQSIADSIASPLDLFDDVKGTDENVNLTGTAKQAWLVNRFGQRGFDYVGNDTNDVAVWSSAHTCHVVSPPDGIAESDGISFSRVFSVERPGMSELFKLIRVHQWSKNLLVAVPIVLDQQVRDPGAVVATLLAILSISFLASATYIFNDMLDLQSDRQNSIKRHRMMASGRVSLQYGFFVALILGLGSLLLAVYLPVRFQLALFTYLMLTVSYTLFLKNKAIMDVIALASLHTLRVIAGAVTIGAGLSFWILAFSMFLFTSLALAKRVAELSNLDRDGGNRSPGRNYYVSDLPFLTSTGISSGLISILVVALYINSEQGIVMYSEPKVLWLACPILMYWILRLWIQTMQGKMHEDPIVYALRDRASLFSGLLLGIVVGVSRLVSL